MHCANLEERIHSVTLSFSHSLTFSLFHSLTFTFHSPTLAAYFAIALNPHPQELDVSFLNNVEEAALCFAVDRCGESSLASLSLPPDQ